jgi:tetratricopeptide (TPR) repeat protein
MKKATVFFVLLAVVSLAFAGMELTSARVYRKQGDLLKSLNFYDQAMQKEPTNVEVYMERGEIYHDIALEPAKADLAKQLTNNAPNPQDVLLDRMLADFKEAQVSKKAGDDALVKKNKKKIDELLQMSWSHFYFLAVHADSSFTKATADGTTDPNPRTFLYACLNDLDHAIKLLPDKWNAYGFKAQVMTKLDSTEASAANWELALQKIESVDHKKDEYKQGASIAREALLVDYYKLDRNDKILLMADLVLKDDPGNLNAIQLKANTLARMTADSSLTQAQRDSMKNIAIGALESAEKSSTDSASLADIKYTIGQFKLQLTDTAGAMQAFGDVLKFNPKDKDVMFVLGVLYLEGGTFADNQKAKEMFEKITVEFPKEGKAWINYGIALIRMNKNAEGKTAIEKGKALSQ